MRVNERVYNSRPNETSRNGLQEKTKKTTNNDNNYYIYSYRNIKKQWQKFNEFNFSDVFVCAIFS